jgi:uncharacterized Ntn-hydrolase superfamily protein
MTGRSSLTQRLHRVLNMTFSIVATDGTAAGVAVASKFLAVGSVVPEARLGEGGDVLVGAAATQASAKWSYKGDALRLLGEGRDATSAVEEVTAADPGREDRQLGVVGVNSQATYTGRDCLSWAGGRSGADDSGRYAIQGNILVGEQVVADMERAWFNSAGQPLERRLVAALLAGDAAGGDARGRQSAALFVVAAGEGYDRSGVRADLRVDDHPQAPQELARLLDLSDLYFGGPQDVQPLTGDLAAEVSERLARLGYAGTASDALAEWAGVENYEMRLTDEGIDARVLQALRAATPD